VNQAVQLKEVRRVQVEHQKAELQTQAVQIQNRLVVTSVLDAPRYAMNQRTNASHAWRVPTAKIRRRSFAILVTTPALVALQLEIVRVHRNRFATLTKTLA